MARARRAARRGAQRQGRELAGGHRACRRSDPARRGRPLRGVRRCAGLPEGLSRAAQHVCRRPAQHDARLSRPSDQVGAERRVPRSLPQGQQADPARDRRAWADLREHRHWRCDRRHEIPLARLARARRRPLHRHRHLQHHPRPGGELAQRRRLPGDGARQDLGRHADGGGPSRCHSLREIPQARRADAGGDGARRRSAVLLLRRAGGALWRVRDRRGRWASRQGDEDGEGQGHRAAVSR